MDALDTPLPVPLAGPVSATLASSLLFRTESAQSGQSHHSHHSNPHSPTPPMNATTVHSSPNRSPRRMNTDPRISSNPELRLRVHKRIVVCCDGTWQDGIGELSRSRYTNVLRLARTIHHQDERFQPPIPQIVYYQSGIGTQKNFYSEYIEGTTGGSLADKVEEAYAFVAHNYNPGDEIFLFGFSRGAYTARMVAMLIGEFGVLDRKDMDHFAKIFIGYQQIGKTSNAEESAKLRAELEPWTRKGAKGKERADSDGDKFTIKCIGVFDTVGSVGVPETLRLRSPKTLNILGMKDNILGAHIERAYQALALNEERKDFMCNRWEQTEKGRQRNQVVRQCWFPGAHSDVGGGFPVHDLADLSLVWMASQIEDALGLDIDYLANLLKPVAAWGKQKPHKKSGIFAILPNVKRPLPTETNDITHEYIHPSVLEQTKIDSHLSAIIEKNPDIVGTLFPLEEGFRKNWPFVEDSIAARTYSSELENQVTADALKYDTFSIVRSASRFTSTIKRSLSSSPGRPQKSDSTVAAGLVRRVSENSPRKSEGLPRRSEDISGNQADKDKNNADVAIRRVGSESQKLKKTRRPSSPLPSISVVAGH